ncbi:MAG: DUF3866 family protein [Solirubrobacterales bacterium]
MLKLRRGTVVATGPLEVRIGDETRPAWADFSLIGPCDIGDDVVVNVEALDLGLGSGGFDVVLVNLTRGLASEGADVEHVMKLNYSPLQHPVATVEREVGNGTDHPASSIPILAIALHGHLAPAAWACALKASESGNPQPSIGYIQTGGGALPGALSRDVSQLLDAGLLADHVTAGPAYGGPKEAITLIGAIDAAGSLGWDGVIAGPGPGILGSATTYGHGGMAALDVAHAGLSLDFPVILSARLSSGDPRPRHRGLSHHSRTVMRLVLGGVDVPLPEGSEDLAAVVNGEGRGRHRVTTEAVDLDGYFASGLPSRTMGRDLHQDPEFFAGPLAAGSRLASLIPG